MIVIQAGHLNIASNCEWGLRPDTGLDGEADRTTWCAQQLSSKLMARGLPVQVVDANFNCLDAAALDYQAVIALHCDEPVAAGVGHPEVDGVGAVSTALASAIADRLHAALGVLVPIQAGQATDHHLVRKLSAATPFVLVQLGTVEAVQAAADQLVQAVYVGVLDWLGMPETEPKPQWQTNLVPHQALLVLNRPVAEVDMGNGIRGNPVSGALQVAFATRVGDVEYYATAESVRGGLGFIRTEADAAGGVTTSAPLFAAAPAPAPPPVAAAEAPLPPPPAGQAPAPPAGLLGLLRDLHQALPDLIAHLEGRS